MSQLLDKMPPAYGSRLRLAQVDFYFEIIAC